MTQFCVCGQKLEPLVRQNIPMLACDACGLYVSNLFALSAEYLAALWGRETITGPRALGLDPDEHVLAVSQGYRTKTLDVRSIRASAINAAAYLSQANSLIGLVFKTRDDTRIEIEVPIEHLAALAENLNEILETLEVEVEQ